jgi:alkanesulfonate monooxygenase SsuD/methylene tetrahydromethanopterin reductase-like flavin-dependent oxidoreductase (luciferase family)
VQVGVGLPTTTPATPPQLVLEWAARADSGPFSSLAVLDRVTYDGYDPLIALTAAAAVTTRVQLATTVLVGPLRPRGVLVKEIVSLNELSGGRLTVGLAVGARIADYEAAGVPFGGRARRLEEQLALLRGLSEAVGIGPTGERRAGPELLVGGLAAGAFERAARYADGYVHGGGPPRAFASAATRARAAWRALDRPHEPRLWGHAYFALGGAEAGAAYLRDYYAFAGAFAERIAAGILTTPAAIRDLVRAYADAGCDELVLFPTGADAEQLEHHAEALA